MTPKGSSGSPHPARSPTKDVIDVGRLYAAHAALKLASAAIVHGLQTATASRHVIAMAQGIVMEHYGIDRDAAFALLQRISSTTNVKLRKRGRKDRRDALDPVHHEPTRLRP